MLLEYRGNKTVAALKFVFDFIIILFHFIYLLIVFYYYYYFIVFSAALSLWQWLYMQTTLYAGWTLWFPGLVGVGMEV